MSSLKLCMHCFVSGRVQGVSFRHYTRQEALRLGVEGWIRNLADGRIEVMVYGEAKSVEKLCSWLHNGPILARVTEVKCNKIAPPEDLEGFTIQ